MARKRRTQIGFKQKNKRKKRRLRLSEKGRNPDDYFYDGFCVTRSKN